MFYFFSQSLAQHGHPDHVTNCWRWARQYPSAPIYVFSDNVKRELIALMKVFGPFGNTRFERKRELAAFSSIFCSDPGDPVGPGPKFNYSSILVAKTENDVWAPSSSSNLTHFKLHSTETTFSSAFTFADENDTFVMTGDLLYINSHLFMGYNVDLVAQCHWITQLQKVA